MKKYRIQRASPWGIYGKFALFFALWNYIGYKLYHKLSDSGRKKNKSFDNLPFSQKILTLYKDPTDEIQFVKMEGMTVKGTRKIAVGELGQKIDVNDKTASSNVVDSEELKD